MTEQDVPAGPVLKPSERIRILAALEGSAIPARRWRETERAVCAAVAALLSSAREEGEHWKAKYEEQLAATRMVDDMRMAEIGRLNDELRSAREEGREAEQKRGATARFTAYEALVHAPRTCRYHGSDLTKSGLDRGLPACESCRQPYRVVAALDAIDRYTRDPS